MWPRHTGDFAIFRVYTAPDGSPADYAPENIPLKPKHHLPISIDGVQKDDFTMIWGYPGGTDRYLTSFGVNFNLDKQYPPIIDLFGKKLDIWKTYMDADPQVRIQYASKHAVTANTWKYLIGQTLGLKNLDVEAKNEKSKQLSPVGLNKILQEKLPMAKFCQQWKRPTNKWEAPFSHCCTMQWPV